MVELSGAKGKLANTGNVYIEMPLASPLPLLCDGELCMEAEATELREDPLAMEEDAHVLVIAPFLIAAATLMQLIHFNLRVRRGPALL